jgi:hypothetical protein
VVVSTDSGIGADTAVKAVSFILAETGSGSDISSQLKVVEIVGDFAVGTETFPLAALAVDGGFAIDIANLRAVIAAMDFGIAAEVAIRYHPYPPIPPDIVSVENLPPAILVAASQESATLVATISRPAKVTAGKQRNAITVSRIMSTPTLRRVD